jgi:hypothetical protein
VFIFKFTEPSPLHWQDSSSVRQKGGLPGPHPSSLDRSRIHAQAVYAEALLPGSSGPDCFQALASSPGLLQSPIL